MPIDEGQPAGQGNGGGGPGAISGQHNAVTGSVTGPVVQAGTVYGGLHLHGAARPGPVPSQLPPPVDLSGRSRDLAALDEARANRTIVISGPPGIGKTALAVGWGHARREQFPGGQLFADLRGHAADGPAGPGEVLAMFLRSLGVAPAAVPAELPELTALYRSVTSERRVIVVLDDAISAAQVTPLLPAPGQNVALITSRWRLAALVARGARTVQLDRLESDAALDLLGRALGQERVAAESTAARELAELCARFPLTLCVTAARLAVRPRLLIQEMTDALREERRRLTLLSADEDMAMRAALDLSYEGVPRGAARVYRFMGLFPGRWFGSGVASAATVQSREAAADLLEVLADANLVDDTADGAYRFHDLIKIHAREMAEREEPPQARGLAVRRMLDWYLATVTDAGQAVTPYRRDQLRTIKYPPRDPVRFTDSGVALNWLERELPNLHSVVSYARDNGFPDVAWQTVDAMWPLFLRQGHHRERAEFDRAGLAAARAAGSDLGEAKMLDRLGLALTSQRRLDEAAGCFTQALAIWRARADERRIAGSVERLGLVEQAQGRHEEAVLLFRQALAAYRGLGDQRGTGLTLAKLGHALTDAGQPAEAIASLREARAVLADVPDPFNQARTLAWLGRAQQHAGDGAAAADTYAQALQAMRDARSALGEAEVLHLLGGLAQSEGRPAAARGHYEAALAIFERIGAPAAGTVREHLAGLERAP